ncbi:hypothetical protein F4778DRAFT_752888 [Xylariomycetidae sp. FL2044]|nr:hypothetical protein F4778DRAFT_752888 [Xylariomycetidae sp. FL2044]
MAIPMLLALTICPAMLGTQEAIRQSQSKTKREEHRSRRCNLVVSCVKPSIRSRDIHGKLVVLRDNKLYVTTGPPMPEDDEKAIPSNTGYPFAGYFLPYPDSSYEGVVSTISDDPPMLNWIYVDKDTYELKYGVRANAQENITGPFDCTRQDRRMTLEGWEGFVAVEEFPGTWALYFDKDDDGLVTKVPMGTRVLEVELIRREKKERKPEPDPNEPKTLEEKMKQHKEQTQREEEERQEAMRQQQYQDEESTREAAAAAAESVTATARAQHADSSEIWVDDIPNAPTDTNAAHDIGRLSINTIKDIDISGLKISKTSPAREHAGEPTSRSPSVYDGLSFWSRARKTGAASDNDSVTAPSSVGERDEAGIREGEARSYRRPYVEDEGEEEGEREERVDATPSRGMKRTSAQAFT